MTVLESLAVAFFCILMVFVVLACLCVLIKLFSLGISAISGNGKTSTKALVKSESVPVVDEQVEVSSGELKLQNVDERTAAMIMAIVSDESGIPLSELCFKSIKNVEKD